MSDLLFERNNDGKRLSVGRFWKKGEDWIQFTTNSEYAQISYKDFKLLVQAVEENVKETKDAWWHKL